MIIDTNIYYYTLLYNIYLYFILDYYILYLYQNITL
jgi:hypothetical protein